MDTQDKSRRSVIVYCWNAARDKRKFFNSYTDYAQANNVVRQLREYGIDAGVLPAGESLPIYG